MDAELTRFLDLLDAVDNATIGTSVRLPVALRDAAAAAVRAGLAESTTEVTVRGLQAELERIAQRAVLEAHYDEHPEVRPDLAALAQAAALLTEHPLRDRPEFVARAAAEITSIVDDPSPQEVLAYAAGLDAGAAA